jgi:hypothetical protein
MLDDIPSPRRPVFNPVMLREIIGGVLTDRYTVPGPAALEALASQLNHLHYTYVFSNTLAKANEARAEKVGAAFAVLQSFFNERREACTPGKGVHAQVIEREKHLYI